MLCDPEKRYSAQQVLNHTWVNNLAPNSNEVVLSLNIDNLSNYNKANKLKKAVLTFIASRLQDSDIEELKEIFFALDKDKDGTLDLKEIQEGMLKVKGVNKLNVEDVFNSLNKHNSGKVYYTDFLAATMDPKIYLKEERLYEAFKVFDKDNSGNISLEEIRKVVSDTAIDMGNAEELLKEYDSNNDGAIDYNEFVIMMSKVEL